MAEQITDKKLKNKRFRKTEEAIIMAFFTAKEILSVDRLIKIAGISRSTLYRHHKSVYEIAPNYERYILKKYNRALKRSLKIKRVRLPGIYRKTLIFIKSHHQIIEFLLQYGKPDLIEKMINMLKPKLISTGKITNEAMFEIYCKEVSGVITRWILDGSAKSEILSVVDKIIYLTDSAKLRLSPITEQTKIC